MDRLQSMRVFAKVVDTGNFVSAADALGLANSVVTRYVADLEQHLGARLLNRTTRRLSLTEAGQLYVERCHQILAEIDEADRAVSQTTGALRGPLKINAPVSFGVRHLSAVVSTFMRQHPEVVLDLTFMDRVVDLTEEGVDLAIRIARIPSSSMIARKFATARMVLCASPGYIENHGAPAHPDELIQHRCLQYAYWSTRDEWHMTGPDRQDIHARIKSKLYSNNGETLRMAACDNAGIVLLPSFIIGQDLLEGRLVQLLPAYSVPDLGIYAVYNSRRYLSSKLRVFIDLLVSSFAGELEWDAWMRGPVARASDL